MTFQHRSGAGSLFKNKLKQEGENTPDYRGEININGGLYELAAWIKDGQRGKYMSLSAKPKVEAAKPEIDDSMAF